MRSHYGLEPILAGRAAERRFRDFGISDTIVERQAVARQSAVQATVLATTGSRTRPAPPRPGGAAPSSLLRPPNPFVRPGGILPIPRGPILVAATMPTPTPTPDGGQTYSPTDTTVSSGPAADQIVDVTPPTTEPPTTVEEQLIFKADAAQPTPAVKPSTPAGALVGAGAGFLAGGVIGAVIGGIAGHFITKPKPAAAPAVGFYGFGQEDFVSLPSGPPTDYVSLPGPMPATIDLMPSITAIETSAPATSPAGATLLDYLTAAGKIAVAVSGGIQAARAPKATIQPKPMSKPGSIGGLSPTVLLIGAGILGVVLLSRK